MKIYVAFLLIIVVLLVGSIQTTLGEDKEGKSSTASTQSSVLNGQVGSQDFSNESLFTGNVAFSIPLASIGGMQVALSYNSNVHNIISANNKNLQAGWIGVGWTLNLGSIVADINNTRDVTDDKYYFVSSSGSSELVYLQGNDFALKDYQYWKITRQLDANSNIIGWVIVTDDGTIYRYGNYDKISSNFFFEISATKATRFQLGWGNMVTNPVSNVFNSIYLDNQASYVAYQWDLSDIQDVNGNHTTIFYQQETDVLSVGGISTPISYTQASYPLKISNRTGISVNFILDSLNSNEYVNPPDKIIQRQVQRKYLKKIQVKDEKDSIIQEIELNSNVYDVKGNGQNKRFLTGITIKDRKLIPLPPTTFKYFGVAGVPSGTNLGALDSIKYPSGGKVSYTYKAQALPKVKLDFKQEYSTNNPSVPDMYNSALAGSDFYVVKKNDGTLEVYRWGAKGWYQDTNFPFTYSVNEFKVANDYIAIVDYNHQSKFLNIYQRKDDGWKSFSFDIGTVQQINILGTYSNYCVFRWKSNYHSKFFAITLVNGSWQLNELGDDWNSPTDYMAASCGNKFFVLRDGPNGEDCHVWMFNGSNWELNKSFQPAVSNPYFLIAGPDYFITSDQDHKYNVWKWGKTGWESYPFYHTQGIVTVYPGNNFFAFTDINGSYPKIATWNGSTWSLTDLSTLLNNSSNVCDNLAVGSDFVAAGWIEYSNGSYIGKLGAVSLVNGQWVNLQSQNYIDQVTMLSYIDSRVWPYTNGNTIFVKWLSYDPNSSVSSHIIKAYKENGGIWSSAGELDNVALNTDRQSFVQPGLQFCADAIQPNYLGGCTVTHAFKEAFSSNLSAIYSGNPYDFPISQKTVSDGMGHTYTTNYTFENGVFNSEMTSAEYNKVTVTPPGNVGSTVTYFYNGLGSSDVEDFVDVSNYKQLDGIPYKVKVFSQTDNSNPISTTTSTWSVQPIYPNIVTGVYHKRLVSTVAAKDGISSTVNYGYDNGNGQVDNITEHVGVATDLSGLRDRHTVIYYAYPQNTFMYNSNMLTQIYRKQVWSENSTNGVPISDEITNYDENNGQYLSSSVLTDGNSNWLTTGTVISRDMYGNVTEQVDVNNLMTTTIFGYHSTLPIATGINVDKSKLFVDDFGGGDFSKWGILWSGIVENSTDFSVESDMLKLINNPAPNEGNDILIHDNHSEIMGDIVFEFDVKIAESNNQNLIIACGGNQWLGSAGGPQNAVWSVINNETWYYGIGSEGNMTWHVIKSGLLVGKTYHFKMVINPANERVSYYVDGEEQVLGAYTNYLAANIPITGIQKVAFGNTGLDDISATWKIDNVRLYPQTAIVTSQSYDPTTLQPISSTDANGISTYNVYDDRMRPVTVINHDGDIIKSIDYYSSAENNNGNFDPVNPNYVETKEYSGSNSAITTRVYSDALGRTLQSHVFDISYDMVSAVEYDDAGRQYRQWKPYKNFGHNYDPGFQAKAQALYGVDNPYSEAVYSSDPLSRVLISKPACSSSLNEYINYSYGTEVIDGQQCTYTETKSKLSSNKPWVYTRIYKDMLGRTIKTVSYKENQSIGDGIISRSYYNMLGKPYKSYSPNAFKIREEIPTDVSLSASMPDSSYQALNSITTVSNLNVTGNFSLLAGSTISLRSGFRASVGSNFKAVIGTDFTSCSYNFLGQLTQKNDPDEGTTQYIYDKAGRLRFMIDDVGLASHPNKVLYWKYDHFGRVYEKGYFKKINWGDGVTLQSYANNDPSYPGSGGTWRKKYSYDNIGRLASVSTNNDDDYTAEVEEYFTYDKYSQVIMKGIKVIDYNSTAIYNTSYAYDMMGRTGNIIYPASSSGSSTDLVISYRYDAMGRIMDVLGDYGASIAHYTYNDKGELNDEKLKNSVNLTRTFGYNSKGILTSITNPFFSETMSTNGGVNPSEEYYGGLYGSITTSYGTNVSLPQNHSSYTYKFCYDEYGRMTQASNDDFIGWSIGLSNPTQYDQNGNITTLEHANTTNNYHYQLGNNIIQNIKNTQNSVRLDYTSTQTGQITSAGSTGITNITYDPFTQMPMRVDKAGTTLKFQYDANKERVYKESKGALTVKTLYLHGLNDFPIMQETSDGTERIFVYGPTGLLAVRMDGDWFYMLKDHLGSTRVVLDASGNAAARFDYDPYGKIVDASVEPEMKYLFTGQEWEEEGGYYNFRARFYDSNIGLFYAVDPAHQTYAPFSYCGNNPIVSIDKDGRIFGVDDAVFFAVTFFSAVSKAMAYHFQGKPWYQGFWKGAVIGAVGVTLGQFGGGTFLNNIAWGAGTGGVTGGLSGLLDGNSGSDLWQSFYQAAAWGGAFATLQSGFEAAKNWRDLGRWGTDQGVYEFLAEGAVMNGTVDPTIAQAALDFQTLRFGGPKLIYNEMGVLGDGSPTTNLSTGEINITKAKFLAGPDAVTRAIAHETGHYVNDINWGNGKVGGQIVSPLKSKGSEYGGDGVSGYHYAIENAGKLHIGFNAIGKALDSQWSGQAWSDYNSLKWYYLLPRRAYWPNAR